MTELAAAILTLLTCGVLSAVGVTGIVLMKRVMGGVSTPEPIVEAVPDTEATRPGRGAV